MVLFAAIPSARDRTATTRNAVFFSKLRVAKRISAPRVSKKGKVRMFEVPPQQAEQLVGDWLEAYATASAGQASTLHFPHSSRRIQGQIVPRRVYLGTLKCLVSRLLVQLTGDLRRGFHMDANRTYPSSINKASMQECSNETSRGGGPATNSSGCSCAARTAGG